MECEYVAQLLMKQMDERKNSTKHMGDDDKISATKLLKHHY